MPELSKNAERIRKLALKFPGTEEGTSCNNLAFSISGKNFLFLGSKDETYDLRLRLTDSVEEAQSFGQDGPGKISVGTHGWTHIVLPHAESLPQPLLKRWIAESYELFTPKDKTTKAATGAKKQASKKKAAASRTSKTKQGTKSTSRAKTPVKKKSGRRATR